ncbi:hypothetical protein RUND412_009021 [Rhizina undulata]
MPKAYRGGPEPLALRDYSKPSLGSRGTCMIQAVLEIVDGDRKTLQGCEIVLEEYKKSTGYDILLGVL